MLCADPSLLRSAPFKKNSSFQFAQYSDPLVTLVLNGLLVLGELR